MEDRFAHQMHETFWSPPRHAKRQPMWRRYRWSGLYVLTAITLSLIVGVVDPSTVSTVVGALS